MTKRMAAFAAMLLAAGCSKKPEVSSAYQAACEGPPVRTAERRQAAMEKGVYNRQYDCIDKAALAQEKAVQASREAANTPEALAKQQEEWDRQTAEARERHRAQEYEAKPAAPAFVLRLIDINTASEAELARLPTVSADGAAQIVAERGKSRFRNWDDVAARVFILSQGQSVYYASVSGLTVNGESAPGIPPDARVAASLVEKFGKRP